MRRPLILGCGLAALIALLLFGAALRNVTSGAPQVLLPSPAPRPATSFAALNTRQWLQIAKNPAAHLGEAIVVYGSVTQFDEVTGLDRFRADVSGAAKSHETPALLIGDADGLADLVRFDHFQANVVVTGSVVQNDGIAVPQLEIQALKML